ncbi:MAG: tetratricopeptide repeat protein, partial [Ferruginibacter sp.]
AIPWVNLASLKLRDGKLDQAITLLDSAKKRQHNLPSIDVTYGLAYEKKGNYLLAEELFRNAIKINTRHFLPFDRLGYIYTTTTQYAKADSFFYEGDLRKQGFHFSEVVIEGLDKEANTPTDYPCIFDSANIKKDDPVGQTVWGIMELNAGNIFNAEKHLKTAIALDKTNPLAFHYLGKLLFNQERWQEAEIIFNMAVGNYLNRESFINYVDSIKKNKVNYTNAACNTALFAYFWYEQVEDFYILGEVYKKWGHFTEAGNQYKKIITINPSFIGGYHQLWTLLEFLGRNTDAENVLLDYIKQYKLNLQQNIISRFPDYSEGYRELYAFYKRMIKQFPDDGSWYYKQGVLLYKLAEKRKSDEAYSENERESKESENKNVFEQPDIYAAEIFYYTDLATLPGTGEQIELSPDIRIPYSEEGIAYLKKADSILGGNTNTHAEINERTGDMFLWLDLPELASSHYQIAVDARPDNATTRERLVETYSAAGQLQNALAQLDSLNYRKEINFNKMLMLAEYKMHSGLFTEAQSMLNNAEKIHPYTQHTIIELNSRLQLLSLHPKEALLFYQQLLKGNEKDSMTMYT